MIQTKVCSTVNYMRHKTKRIEPVITVLNVVSRLYADYVVMIFCFCGTTTTTILKTVHFSCLRKLKL